jgi:hypothetical protein
LSGQIDQLTFQNTDLLERNAQLEDRVNQLESDNKRLVEENRLLKELYQSNSTSTSPLSLSNTLDEQVSSPPLTPNSSEESTSLDLFNSEDYSDDLFSNDWQYVDSKVPFAFLAVFFCLFFFFPTSILYPPQIPNTMSSPNSEMSSPSPQFVYVPPSLQVYPSNRRNLLMFDEADKPSLRNDWNCSSTSSRSIHTMDDVIKDELSEKEPFRILIRENSTLISFPPQTSNHSLFTEPTPHFRSLRMESY